MRFALLAALLFCGGDTAAAQLQKPVSKQLFQRSSGVSAPMTWGLSAGSQALMAGGRDTVCTVVHATLRGLLLAVILPGRDGMLRRRGERAFHSVLFRAANISGCLRYCAIC